MENKVKTFEDFWLLLIEHEIWYDQMKMRFHRKDLKGVANECFIFLLASDQRWDTQDYKDFRRCYQSFLSKAPDLIVKPQLQQTAIEEPKHSAPILTGDERQKKLSEWLESVKNVEQQASLVPKLTYKQIADEGDWLPKKNGVVPSTSIEYFINSEIHNEYIRHNYDIITGEKNLDWKSEPDWVRDNQKEINEWLSNMKS